MADQRMNEYAGQYQMRYLERIQTDPWNKKRTPLLAMANTNVISTGKGSNEYRVFTKPFVRGKNSNLTEIRNRAAGNNPLTTKSGAAGTIEIKPVDLKYEDFKIEDTLEFGNEIDLTMGIDNAVNSVENQTKLGKEAHDMALNLNIHELILGQALRSDEWLTGVDDVVTTDAIAATATTFKVSNADAASFAEERFIKIGNKRSVFDPAGLNAKVDVAMVKTVGAADSGGSGKATITIEDNAANFPTGDHADGTGEIFKNLVTELGTHAAGVRVQIDKPIEINESSNPIDKAVVRRIRVAAKRAYMTPNGLVAYMPPEVSDLLESDKTPFVENDFLGKDILSTGRLGRVRGLDVVDDADAITRTLSNGDVIDYVWCFERNESFCYKEYMTSRALAEPVPGTANALLRDTHLYIGGAHAPRPGAMRMILVPIKRL